MAAKDRVHLSRELPPALRKLDDGLRLVAKVIYNVHVMTHTVAEAVQITQERMRQRGMI